MIRRLRCFGPGLMVAAGVLILVALALPAVCWWFVIGLGLLVCGLSLRHKKFR